MAVPFKSTVFTGGSFAASGSNGHSSAGLLIYSSSRASSGLLPAADLAKIGKDVFLFVSGVVGSRGTTTPGTLLVGGDLVISGTAYDGSGNVLGGGAPAYFTSLASGSIQTTGSLTALGKLIAGAGIQASGSSGITGSLVIKDDIADTAQLTLSSSAGSINFDYYSDGNLYVTNNKAAGEVWFSTTQPDTVGSQFLRVKPQNSGRNLVLFNDGMSGGSAANAENSTDTSFFVSGIVNSRGTSTRGTAVFGGDLYVSGTVYSNEFKSTIISSSIIYSSGSTIFGNSADDTHTFIGSITGSSDLLLTGSLNVKGNTILGDATSDTVTIPGTVYLTGPGGQNVIHDAGSGNLSISSLNGNIYVEGTLFNGNDVAIAGDLQVNGGDLTSPATTMNIFNTVQYINLGGLTELRMGAVGSLTTVYGNLQVNGDTTLGNSSADRTYVSGTLTAPAISGSLTRLASGLSYLAAGANVTITTASSGQVTISSAGGGGGGASYFDSTVSSYIYATGSLSLTGQEGIAAATTKGQDVFLYVSGSVGGRGTATGKISLFNGDIVTSGSLYISSSAFFGLANNAASVSHNASSDTLTINSANTLFNGAGSWQASAISYSLNNSDTSTAMLVITEPNDNGDVIVEVGRDAFEAAELRVNGYIVASGSITSLLPYNFIKSVGGFSGSLTRLSDGTSYLVAGSNIAISSQSNGQVTISGTGGSGSPAGANTQVQFNDSGSFGAASSLSFEKATNTFSAQNITLGGNLDSQGVDARWYLRNNSADSLSFWDGTSGSRRFQFNMGDSQERIIAYDNAGFAVGDSKDLEILHDGTDSLLKNNTGKLYISGSTSGVYVTGSAGLFIADGLQPTLTIRASTDATNQSVLYQESGGDTYLSNQKNGGFLYNSVKTTAGVAVRFMRAIPNSINYNTIVSFLQGLHDFFDPKAETTDVGFYVGGKKGSKDSTTRGVALFAGDMVISGSTHMQNGGSITGSFSIQGSIIPSADSTYTLGTDTKRWGHVYTGDLHLRNERGDWTILEEPDFLCVINNKTGQKYKMMLQPID